MPDDATIRDPRQAEVRHDPATGRFVIDVEGGGEARLSYRREGDVLNFYSTWTTPALRGRGLAAEVVRAGFDYAREQGLTVRPTCPYVHTFLRRYPRYRDLLAGSGTLG